jgi:tRNA(His) guanylyltransferase
MHDELGERMKDQYESRSRTFLPRRTHTIIRLDGKAFHTYTKGFERPYDLNLMRIMDQTAEKLCKEIQGAKMAYVQSDEISVLLTDFDTIHTDAWFDGNVQKITSVSASIATAAFNNGMYLDEAILANMDKVAYFDSRVFTVADLQEVVNYFIWRQQDATRNSIQMAAQSVYSQRELNGKGINELQELLFQKGINWDKYPVGFKRGRTVVKHEYVALDRKIPIEDQSPMPMRTKWVSEEPPIFTQDREYITTRIPRL